MLRLGSLLLLIGCAGDQSSPQAAPSEGETEVTAQEDEHRFWIRVDDRTGYVDSTGREVIPPRFYDANHFAEGRAFAMPSAEVGKWGLIDPSGGWVVEPTYENVMVFSEGLAGVQSEGKWGLIDRDGNWVVEPKLEGRIGAVREGRAPVHLDGAVAIIDTQGDEVFRVPSIPFGHGFHEGLLFAEDASGNLCAHDLEGEVVFVAEGVDSVFEFSGGLAIARTDAGWGYLTRSGAWAIQPQYRSAESFSEGIAAVEDQAKRWTFVDTSGQPLLDREWTEDIEPFSEGLAMVRSPENGKYGYIDRTGAWVIEPRFEKPRGTRCRFQNGLAMPDLVGARGKQRVYIDRKGEVVWSP